MTGRVVLVTGATSGIGFVTARELHSMGASVIVHGRTEEKARRAINDIARDAARLHAAAGDFESLDDVRRMAADIKARFPKIHVLVNNAGLWSPKREETRDGFEKHFGVNHLAPFLLANLLLDNIRAGAPARVVNVASRLHRLSRIDFDDLQFHNGYKSPVAYGRSKIANIMFSRELARRNSPDVLTSNSLHPGGISTNITRGKSWWMDALTAVADRVFLISPEEGAKTQIYLASSPEAEGVTGKYFAKCREATLYPTARDDADDARLWDESAKLVGL
ncbi:SDR family oxidoreductase [bacterium]|nr:SDR family oxidoreductase [bacterium]